MFVIHTGLMVEMSICFLNDVKSTYERIDGRLNLQAQLVEALFARINYFLSDFIVVWRAWSLSESLPRFKSRYVLSLCLFASFVMLVVDGAFTLVALSKQNLQDQSLALSSIGTTPIQRLGMLRIALPLVLFVTNTVATGYIGVTCWMFRRAISSSVEKPKEIINIGQTLLFMFESGFLYSMIWIVIIFDIAVSFPAKVTIALDLIIPQITAIYPALIILLNAAQKSISDEKDKEEATHPAATVQATRSVILTTQFQLDTVDFNIYGASFAKSSADDESSV
ncbi:hypothetical protein GYMLUDRAFT_44799 [Collybiopsis luxurians FD-317 M1]|uniref:Uncharacterized protein n=1 Tax=Collybiopsis luxurians FD-317 M1 TaxID=944289 RepID=A0A0D0BUD0_9AGAR|nr:hypothetical protein GYMLUDRAFT_44799 [Collybiopsis luxurians FD-317 M1]